MNKYLKSFFHRGLVFGGFGPIVAGIVFFILSLTQNINLTGTQVFVAIMSTYVLAFLHAGASVFNQIEHWPITKSLLCHFLTLYIAYIGCYVINSWIPFEPMVLLIFTAIFVVTYFVIWLSVFIAIRSTGKKLNQKLK